MIHKGGIIPESDCPVNLGESSRSGFNLCFELPVTPDVLKHGLYSNASQTLSEFIPSVFSFWTPISCRKSPQLTREGLLRIELGVEVG